MECELFLNKDEKYLYYFDLCTKIPQNIWRYRVIKLSYPYCTYWDLPLHPSCPIKHIPHPISFTLSPPLMAIQVQHILNNPILVTTKLISTPHSEPLPCLILIITPLHLIFTYHLFSVHPVFTLCYQHLSYLSFSIPSSICYHTPVTLTTFMYSWTLSLLF